MPNFDLSGVSYQSYKSRAITQNATGEDRPVDTIAFKAFGKLIDLISRHLETAEHKGPPKSKGSEGTGGNSKPEECHGRNFRFRRIDDHRFEGIEAAKSQINKCGTEEPSDKEEVGLAGDFNNDGVVGLDDLNIYRNTEGSTGENLAADANRDGTVNELDRKILLDNFGAKKE